MSAHPMLRVRKREEGDTTLKSELTQYLLDPMHRKHVKFKTLYGHGGCVNALAFTVSGKHLVSGGDDHLIKVWDADVATYGRQANPASFQMDGHHESNVFCIDTSSDSRIISGGNDFRVLVHDMETRKTIDVFVLEDAVYGCGFHPTLPDVFATACSDGSAQIFDLRTQAHQADIELASNANGPFLSVQYSPSEEQYILTSSQYSKFGASLFDVRNPGNPVVKFGKIKAAMFAKFDTLGRRVLVLERQQGPCVFDVTMPWTPIATFDAPEYYNNCTMKSACFASVEDSYILSGSDDFKIYAWKIPEREEQEILVARPTAVLRGHKSIVNQVKSRQEDGLIASSGVERVIILWSGANMKGSEDLLSASALSKRIKESRSSPEDVQPFSGAESPTEESPRMLAFFDRLLRHELTNHHDDYGDSHHEYSDSSSTSQSEREEIDSSDISALIARKRSMIKKQRRKAAKRGLSSSSDEFTVTERGSLEDVSRPVLGEDIAGNDSEDEYYSHISSNPCSSINSPEENGPTSPDS